MATTYKATGINLKGSPLGESDRLLTVLTREHGLMRVVVPGARKANSKLGGRSALFVVNELLISKGRSLDRIVQAETLESYPGLGQDLRKLTASQYLAELVLFQALSDHPQDELFCLLNEHFTRLDDAPADLAIACLTHAIYHFLATAGIPPQVHECCLTQQPLSVDEHSPSQAAEFSVVAGGTVRLGALRFSSSLEKKMGRSPSAASGESRYSGAATSQPRHAPNQTSIQKESSRTVTSSAGQYSATVPSRLIKQKGNFVTSLSALELAILQCLAQPTLIRADGRLNLDDTPDLSALLQPVPVPVWLKLEQVLRRYAEYQFDRPIRSASLIDTCFAVSS